MPHPTDAQLVAGMRAGREAAYAEFVRRWQPLLSDAARRLGLAPDDGDDLVADVLVEAATAFGSGRAAPRAMGAYLTTALRNRARNHWRDEARRRAREAAAYAAATGDAGALEVAGVAEATADGHGADGAPSADGVRRMTGHAAGYAGSRAAAARVREPAAPAVPDDSPLAPPPLARLAEALTRGLSRDERLLLVWSGHHVPHRTIAEWLGSTPGAVGKRLERLRARLRRAALAHLEDVPAAERALLVRFLRRADVGGTGDVPDDPSGAGPNGPDANEAGRDSRACAVPSRSGEE